MRFAQFYKDSTGYVPGTIPPQFDPAHVEPIEACGTDGVIIIDARIKKETAGRIAAETCKKRGYIGWRMYEGEKFSNAKPVSGYWPVVNKEDRTASSASYGA